MRTQIDLITDLNNRKEKTSSYSRYMNIVSSRFGNQFSVKFFQFINNKNRKNL